MSTKIFVGNLSWDTTEESLKDLFSSVGPIESVEVAVKEDGRSRGFAFVVFSNDEDAIKAIKEKNNAEIDGRNIQVKLTDENSNGRKVFVGGLAWATSEETMAEHFSSVGEVLDAKVVMDRDTRRSKGFGFVTFATAEEANKAVDELNESELDGRNIRVSLAEAKQSA